MPEKKRILVIDDDKDICRTLEVQLKMSGYDVLISLNGQEGLKIAKEGTADLVILDLGLPGLPGEEVCRQLKKDDRYNKLPIIMLTAKGTDVDKVIGKVIGAAYYIHKPFDMEGLLTKINGCL